MISGKVRISFAVGSFVASLLFGTAGLLMPPMGSINPSVLIWLGQLLLFTSMLLGFSVKDNQLLKELTDLTKELKSELTNDNKINE